MEMTDTAREEIAEGLSRLLADTYTLYLKTQGFHWNVTGPMFWSLHDMFEEEYVELREAVDEIAERIRALGHPAPASYAEFSTLGSVADEQGETGDGLDMVRRLLDGHETAIGTARAVVEAAEEAGDYATADMATERIQSHEKTAWMLRSTLA